MDHVEIESQPEAVYDPEMCARLRAFPESGVRVALDDFGEGPIPYATPRDAPFDVVKLPVMYVQRSGRAYDDAVLTAGLAFARALGAITVAEGVETVEMRDRMRALGCDLGQGYLWSRQVEASAFPALVAAIRSDGTDVRKP